MIARRVRPALGRTVRRAPAALATHHTRHWLLGALTAGLALAATGGLAVAAALAALAAGTLAAVRGSHGGRPAWVPLAAGALAATGVALGAVRLAVIDAGAARLSPGDAVAGRAILLTPPRRGQFGAAAEVVVRDGPARGARLLARFPAAARLPSGPGAELIFGGSVRDPGPARPRAGGRGPPFDARAWMRRRGLAGELRVRWVRATGRRRGGPAGLLDRARERALGAVRRGLSPQEGALVSGMVLGRDDLISGSVRSDFRDSGLAHLLAVSGQNVMLLAALALALAGVAGVGPRARLIAAMALVAGYVPLAGAGPSLQRAGVMGIAALAALALGRPSSRWYALLLAAAVTLAADPRAVTQPGWQLSFAAVVGILALAPALRSALRALPRAIAEAVAVTVAATLATAPLIAFHFGAAAPASLPANVAAVPLVAPIMWLGMARAAIGAIAPPGAATTGPFLDAGAVVLGPLADALAAVAGAFAAAPGATMGLPAGSALVAVLGYGGVLAAAGLARAARRRHGAALAAAHAAWRRRPRRTRSAVTALGCAAVAAALALWLSPPGPPRELTVSFLDVGQGDATLIQDPRGATVLFDGGPPEGEVVRLLRRAGVRRLDVLVITHPARDHYGGLEEVVRRLPVGVLVDGGEGTRAPAYRRVVAAAVRGGARRLAGVAPLALAAGTIRVRVISPASRAEPEDENAAGVVAIVRSGGFSLYLSGDAEAGALPELPVPAVDAMKVPHHGSADPGLPGLLTRLRPAMAAIPVGAANPYGHPTPGTLAALRAAGVPTWRSDRNGTVRVTVAGGGISVSAQRGGPMRPHPPGAVAGAP